MGHFARVLVSRAADLVRRAWSHTVTPVVSSAQRWSDRLWGQRFHWPVVGLGGAVLAAAVVVPVMAVSTAARHPFRPASAGDWPGLLHRAVVSTPGQATAPANVVPGCASPGGSTTPELTSLRVARARPAGSQPGGVRVTLAALSLSSPVVTSVSPSGGPAAGGTAVVIDGSGFNAGIVVTFGVVPATASVVSDTEITATSPPGIGTVDVRVLALGIPSSATAADQFTYAAPSLGSLNPPPAPSLPGSTTTTGPVTSGAGVPTGRSPSAPPPPVGSPPGSTPSPSALPSPADGFGSTFGWGGGLGCSLIDYQTGVPVSGESPAQERAVQMALSLIGTPYVWGGESTAGFDCSGLVQYVFSAAGIALPRTAQDQFNAGPAVPAGHVVVPGDLVFFGSGPNGVGHVGIFVGNGVMVDAPHTGADVRLDQISGFEQIVGVTSPGG
jgi:cell wall-associated NlpC family hydrolase